MQHPIIDFNPFDNTINIRSFNKRIDVRSEEFWALRVVISHVLQCSISINRNKLISLKDVGAGAAIPVDIATTDFICNYYPEVLSTEVKMPFKSIDIDRMAVIPDANGNSVLALPINAIIEQSFDLPNDYVQLVQLTLVTEPIDVGLVGFVLQLLRLVL